VVLIGLYLAARLALSLQHETDLSAFRAERPARETAVSYAMAEPEAPEESSAAYSGYREGSAANDVRASTLSQALWSEQRLRAHRAALDDASERPSIEGVLRVPALDLEVVVYAGTDERTLVRGAGRIEGTPPLGSAGNIGIAAHRDGFFRALKDLAVGDEIVVELMSQTQRYEVVRTLIVKPEDTWVLAPTEEPTLTLVTCYPFYFVGSAPERFIAQAKSLPGPW
jgi:sortase A